MNDFILKTQRTICDDHGGYDAKLVEQFTGPAIWTGCPRCEFDARHSADSQVRQHAHDLLDSRTTNALLMASNIQHRFRGLGLDSYRTDFAPGDQPGVLARCRGYAENFDQNWEAGRSLILLGTMGTGKTHLASAIIQEVIKADALGGANALYTTASDIIRSVKRGLYAVHFRGGQVDITNGKFVFSASEAYLIEDGRVTAPVRGATLIGNGPDALTKVDAVGTDLKLDYGVGVCQKDGQSVPVGVGLPTIRISEMTVGGTKG